jgi:hypothetical protein
MSPQPAVGSQRPSGPKVFGVLSIVFASMTIFSSLLGGCSLGLTRGGGKAAMGAAFAGMAGSQSSMAEAYQRYYQETFVASAAQVALLLALSILLLFVGIGQLRYRRWARAGSQAWGAAGLLAVGAMQLLAYVVFRPASQKLMADLVHGMRVGSSEAAIMGWMSSLMGGGAMSGMMLIFYLPYPLLLLIYFSRARVREAMTAES